MSSLMQPLRQFAIAHCHLPFQGRLWGGGCTNQQGTLSRPLQFFVLYSFLIAAKGESFMARIAGYRPDMSATTTENANAPTAR